MAVVVTACGGDPLDRLAEGERGRVASVQAGGRMTLADGAVVRLAGIDVPSGSEPGGDDARAVLTKLVQGREVALLYGGARRDGFGRAVAQVRTTGGRRWIQGAMLDAGVARVRTTAEDRALSREMLVREARARTKARGLWSSPEWRVRLPGEVTPGFMIIEGRLGPTARARLGYRVSLGGAHGWLSIDRRTASDMEAAGMSPAALENRLVRVRGLARRTRSGFEVIIDHPEQLEPLVDR